MSFRKKPETADQMLAGVVKKVTRMEYIFWNINDDLGHAAEQVMRSSPQVKMSYGYARRAAVAALYLQGLITRDVFEHVSGIFKALQQQTEQTVEFQEKAGEDSIAFMQGYHYLIGPLFVKKLIQIANEYEPPEGRLTDPELFSAITDIVFTEQEESRRGC